MKVEPTHVRSLHSLLSVLFFQQLLTFNEYGGESGPAGYSSTSGCTKSHMRV
jgi:hypothetical protein